MSSFKLSQKVKMNHKIKSFDVCEDIMILASLADSKNGQTAADSIH